MGDAFWTFLDHHGWVYPYDAQGRRRAYADIQTGIAGLADDPYRSLAGEFRRAGGMRKIRRRSANFSGPTICGPCITRKTIAKDFNAAAQKALALAKSVDANFLPGWCGPMAG